MVKTQLNGDGTESYFKLIKRIITMSDNETDYSFENSQESTEILSNPETINSLEKSIENLRNGQLFAIEDV